MNDLTQSQRIARDLAYAADDEHLLYPRSLPRWVWPVCGVAAFLGLLVWGAWLDQVNEVILAGKQHSAYQAGLQKGRAEMVATAEAGWQAAHTESDRCKAPQP